MAFPTGYAKYQNITIDHTKVSADLTDYVVYVNLADLVKAGADIFDTCRTDGGDLRATKTDGTTELAIEIVAIDTTAKTGEVHIKFSGTLSSSTDTVIRIWYNGTDTVPAVTDTYGRNAVWSDYSLVMHMQGNYTSSTGSNSGTSSSGVTYDASYSAFSAGQGADFSGTSSEIVTGMTFSANTPTTTQAWAKYDGTPPSANKNIWSYWSTSIATADARQFAGTNSSTNMRYGDNFGGSYTFGADTWRHFVLSVSATGEKQAYHQGVNTHSKTTSLTAPQYTAFYIGSQKTDGENWNGKIDEVRVRTSVLASTWVSTEYNNQSSPSTFYSIGDEQGGSTIVSPSAQVATFSVPAYTVIRGVLLSVTAQVGTFSLPTRSILIEANVNPATQVATFTVPSYTIIAQSVMFFANANTATFSIPTYEVLRSAIISPDGQTLTFTVPSPTIATGNTVEVQPVTLTFSIPALAFIGALWQRSARSSANWTRSAINND